ncbi:MAG: SRPBCC domain-containing protein [Gammaproteobacteria bacterium]|nr:SRPBCC domain-containing protein [Gammaproteobacteria bacterium]
MADNHTANASIRIHASADTVLSAFTEADKMSQFWITRSDNGMEGGQTVAFQLGSGEDAFSFDVLVKELDFPDKLVIEWQGPDGYYTQVSWTCTETNGSTVLSIEESGFAGDPDNIVARAIDSTGGFNQVIIAAKAFIEHRVSINVVADHAV